MYHKEKENMKTSITLLALIISAFTIGQTNVISLKSHSGNLKDIAFEKGNFGEMRMPRFYVDSVIYLKPGLFIESKHSNELFYPDGQIKNRYRDTISDPSITHVLTFSLKQRYSSSVVFVGFQEQQMNMAKPHFEGMKRNGLGILAIFVELLLVLGLMRNSKLARE